MHDRFSLVRKAATSARLLWAAGFLVLVWLAPVIAWAQQVGGPEEEPEAKSYVLGYALTTLCLGLGLFAVVKPGKRRFAKIKPKTDED